MYVFKRNKLIWFDFKCHTLNQNTTQNWTKSKLVDRSSTEYVCHFLPIICSKYKRGIKYQLTLNSRIFAFFQKLFREVFYNCIRLGQTFSLEIFLKEYFHTFVYKIWQTIKNNPNKAIIIILIENIQIVMLLYFMILGSGNIRCAHTIHWVVCSNKSNLILPCCFWRQKSFQNFFIGLRNVTDNSAVNKALETVWERTC